MVVSNQKSSIDDAFLLRFDASAQWRRHLVCIQRTHLGRIGRRKQQAKSLVEQVANRYIEIRSIPRKKHCVLSSRAEKERARHTRIGQNCDTFSILIVHPPLSIVLTLICVSFQTPNPCIRSVESNLTRSLLLPPSTAWSFACNHTAEFGKTLSFSSGLSLLVVLLGLFVQSTPHLPNFLSNTTKGKVGMVFLDLGALFLGKEHEAFEWLLGTAASLFGL